MTRDDLIIAAPWIALGAGLSGIGLQLLRARRAAGPGPGKRWCGPVSSAVSDPVESNSGQENDQQP